MIKITIPNNNVSERKYIIDILLGEYLGLEYCVDINMESMDYRLELSNNKLIIIKDHFFSKFKEAFSYLNIRNIPKNINFSKNNYIVEENIPIIFGNSEMVVSGKIIECGIDLFASSFFMLTRWEEYVNKNRDSHDRFAAVDSLAYKNGFLDRPVVNEYVEMLKRMFLQLDSSLKFKEYKSKLFISCDVDRPYDCTVKNIKNLLRAGAGDILIRRSIKELVKRIRRYIFNKFGNYKYDENYTFPWYIDVCEGANLKVAFYFIPTSKELRNGCYELQDEKIQNLIKYIDSRGHEIGLHGSYQTYQDKDKVKRQKKMLDSTLKELNIFKKVAGNRQHYLRWDSAITPSILDHAGFEYDTTGSYADMAGFRYGVCCEFSMFDFLNRWKLTLKQRPLIVMECSILSSSYMGLGYTAEALEMMKELKQKCFKYSGNFSLLWHNSSFKNIEDRKMFERVIT